MTALLPVWSKRWEAKSRTSFSHPLLLTNIIKHSRTTVMFWHVVWQHLERNKGCSQLRQDAAALRLRQAAAVGMELHLVGD